jgi:teichuronic acid biosynthesis glycosyltransferase TuaC
MKVVFLSNLFPNPVDSGRGVFSLHIAEKLKELCDLTVVCPLPFFPRWKLFGVFGRWNTFSFIPDGYSVEGIPVLSPKYFILPKISDTFHSALLIPQLLKTIRRLRETVGVDVVNAHWLYPDGVAAASVCKTLNIPLVLTALGSDVNVHAQRPIIGKQIRWAVKNSAAVTAVSRDLANKIDSWGASDNCSFSIPNGVDLSRFRVFDKKECRKELSLPEELKLILYVGRLSEEKGFNHLIDAVEIMFKERNAEKICVVAVGDGPLRTLYEKRVNSKGMTESFIFKGNQEHGLIPQWIGASDLLCLPSLTEGCPNVVMEALSAGRPVVASKVGGVPEMVRDGQQGFLSEAGDPADLLSCIEKALSRDWDAKDLRSAVIEKSWGNVAGSYHEIYRSVLKSLSGGNTLD